MRVLLTLYFHREPFLEHIYDFKISPEAYADWISNGFWPSELQTLSCETMFGVKDIHLAPVEEE